jgi:cytochrome c-type biogenesis protein CcmF
MLLMMGVVPLVAWGSSSIRRLGRAILWPAGITVVIVAVLFALGISQPLALVGYGLSVLAGAVSLLEFHRGAVARVRSHKESYLRALWTLSGRNRRRYGGYAIHIGVVIMAIGIISSYGFQTETQRTVSDGQTITLGSYVLEYDGLERFVATDGRTVVRAVTVLYRNGREVARLSPRMDIYSEGRGVTIPATYMTLSGDDVYIRLVEWDQDDFSSAAIRVYHNPLVNWVWGGGLIFMIGTLVAAWPDFHGERQGVLAPVRQPPPISIN